MRNRARSTQPLAEGLNIIFASPPWTGPASVYVMTSSQLSINFLRVTYALPSIAYLSPPSPVGTAGGGLVVHGSNFGLYAGLGELWMRSGAQYLGLRTALPLDYGANQVLFSYAGSAEVSPRYCAVQSWNDTSIVCRAPEGVAGSVNVVQILHNISVPPQSLFLANQSVQVSAELTALSQGWSTAPSSSDLSNR